MRASTGLVALYGVTLLIALLYMIVPPWSEQADIWETSAAIQAISDAPIAPRNPLLDLPGATSPRFTPYTVAAGFTDRLFGLQLFTTVALWGIVSLVLFVTGLARVIRTLTPDRRAMLWVLPAMLLGWGHGYGEANGYQAELFFATLPYVGMITYGICFHALAELNCYLSSGSRPRLMSYVLLAILAFLTHPITALLLFVAAFAWTVARKGLVSSLLLQAVPLLALGAAFLWPYFDYFALLFRGSTEQWYQVRLFDDQLTKIGPALLGIPVAVYFALRRRHPELVLALGLSLLIYLTSWALDIQIGSRFVFYGAMFAHWILALFFLESGVFSRGFLRRPLVQSGIVLFLLVAVLGVGSYYRVRKLEKQWTPAVEHYQTTHGDLLEPWEDLRFLRSHLNSESVVMVEDTLGWRLPAVTGARLVAQAKGDPLITDEITRRRTDMHRFYYGPTETADRFELLRDYGCTHIVIDERRVLNYTESLKQDVLALADLVVAKPPLRLYKVKALRG